MALDIADFSAFFQGIHDKTPFLWQMRLAEKVAREGWPDVIDLPTASGKTACVDIAVFHLALSPEAARRIFFVVDRRLIVNQVFERMCRIAGKISSAQDGVLKEVATRLQSLAGPFAPNPLEAYELRGGVYRDPSWVKTPLQPTLVSSTVDQVGSRILFRGYGVSDSAWPIHAGLIANDSLIFLDEAHCSPAFARTLQAIERYRGSDWACEPLPQSFRFVEMTATPTRDSPKRFQLEPEDKSPDQLGNRIFAAKPTRVVEGKHKSNDPLKSAAVFVKEMDALKHELPSARRIGIIVNRIATARAIYSELLADTSYAGNVHLMIGRMRPIDRDRLTADLAPLKSGAIRSPQDPFRIVVATQCLEVGADLDFDILLTECASIDALLQRFGRLNRLGAAPECRGCIIASTSQAEGKNSDPVYGPSLSDTWRWLNTLTAADGTVNMGIEAPAGHPPSVAQCLTESVKDLRIPEKLSPALLPAHLDALCQTNPVPACEPSVALFLHGVDSGEPDVQVVWRADLELDQIDQWPAIIRLCPPVSAEAMPVRISTFRKWLSGDDNDSARAGPPWRYYRSSRFSRMLERFWPHPARRGDRLRRLRAGNRAT
jgi:CRISPR-associated endonuclease/helicase Cas3